MAQVKLIKTVSVELTEDEFETMMYALNNVGKVREGLVADGLVHKAAVLHDQIAEGMQEALGGPIDHREDVNDYNYR